MLVKNLERQLWKWALVLCSSIALAAPPGTTDERIEANIGTGHLRVGAGIGTPQGDTGVPVSVGAWFQVTEGGSVLVGFDTGFIFSKVGTILPLMGSATVFLGPLKGTALQPYLGGSLGPTFGLSGYGNSLAALFRPGVFVNLSSDLDASFELPFGSLNKDFYIGPQINLVLYL